MEQQFFKYPNLFIGHVELKVVDLERSLKFYKETIGFHVLRRSHKEAVLTANGRTPLLTILQPNNIQPKQEQTTGLYHFAILLPDRLSLAKVLKHLRENRIPIGSSDHFVSEALYLEDPDGNGIEIYSDRPSTEWKWQDSQVIMGIDPLDTQGLLQLAGDSAWKALPEKSVIGHIHLHVSELTNTEAFYRALGFETVSRLGGRAVFISSGKYHHHIGLNTWVGVGAQPSAENNAGLKFFSIVYPDIATRDLAIKRLKELGYEPKVDGESFVIHDPSENMIKITL
ncbi:VOC family protein [Halobacillus massiliensis]|uniref:VOC family protein n=1 Tax=Halobacillus massiliensis TaxID=1926286 RepID=UPI001FED1BE0|nr:VOC family protein [Halobacillus massiliensis]